jgi:hypothetical protein
LGDEQQCADADQGDPGEETFGPRRVNAGESVLGVHGRIPCEILPSSYRPASHVM